MEPKTSVHGITQPNEDLHGRADDLHGRTGENGSLLIEEEKLSQLLPTPSIDKLSWSSYE